MIYTHEIQYAIKELMSAGQSFDVIEIQEIVELILQDVGGYYDPVEESSIKKALLMLFEKGAMPGYCLILKYMVGDDGPFVTYEFKPDNPFATVTMIKKPEEDSKRLSCVIHPYFKDLIVEISKHAGTTQDQMVRSILIKALIMVRDQVR